MALDDEDMTTSGADVEGPADSGAAGGTPGVHDGGADGGADSGAEGRPTRAPAAAPRRRRRRRRRRRGRGPGRLRRGQRHPGRARRRRGRGRGQRCQPRSPQRVLRNRSSRSPRPAVPRDPLRVTGGPLRAARCRAAGPVRRRSGRVRRAALGPGTAADPQRCRSGICSTSTASTSSCRAAACVPCSSAWPRRARCSTRRRSPHLAEWAPRSATRSVTTRWRPCSATARPSSCRPCTATGRR